MSPNKVNNMMDTQERYFSVAYTANNLQNQTCYGCCNFIVDDGRYLNRARAIKYIENSATPLKDATIANITELSEQDYNDWIK